VRVAGHVVLFFPVSLEYSMQHFVRLIDGHSCSFIEEQDRCTFDTGITSSVKNKSFRFCYTSFQTRREHKAVSTPNLLLSTLLTSGQSTSTTRSSRCILWTLPFSSRKHLSILARFYSISFLIALDIQGAKASDGQTWDTLTLKAAIEAENHQLAQALFHE